MKKIALITGATSGIGRATAEKFALQNYKLIICGRNKKVLQELSDILSKTTEVISLSFDVRNNEEVSKAIDSLKQEWTNIDVLVNSAGNAHGLSSIENGDISDWDAMIDGNTKGLLYVSKAIIKGMVERKKGHIVNISSIAGKITYQNGGVYCASKRAVEAISEGMRLDLTQHGIKITNIAPGAVETAFSLTRFKGDKERAENVYKGYEALKAEDVANLIFYAVDSPPHVTIADCVIYPSAQSSPTTITKN